MIRFHGGEIRADRVVGEVRAVSADGAFVVVDSGFDPKPGRLKALRKSACTSKQVNGSCFNHFLSARKLSVTPLLQTINGYSEAGADWTGDRLGP